MRRFKTMLIIFVFVGVLSCDKGDDPKTTTLEYDDTPLELNIGNLPEPAWPEDNKLTVAGVELGTLLFYETLLSKDGSQSCGSCHEQADGFSDSDKFSEGVEGEFGKRQAMPIFNMAWHDNQFFWDGRANLLRDQALKPIQDPLEMNETLENVVEKLSNSPIYPDRFMRAFGSIEVTDVKISLALEQFMMSIISADSKYDKFLAGTEQLSDSEERGRLLYETEYNPFFPSQSGADCAHCHGGSNFENDEYMNNGLDTDADMVDIGREDVTGLPEDRAKFKVPSLRNIEVTAPYMHDGRFTTLEEVVNHYNEGINESSSVDPAILTTKQTGLMLTNEDKVDLINFLKTLTDQQFLSNQSHSNPFTQ